MLMQRVTLGNDPVMDVRVSAKLICLEDVVFFAGDDFIAILLALIGSIIAPIYIHTFHFSLSLSRIYNQALRRRRAAARFLRLYE